MAKELAIDDNELCIMVFLNTINQGKTFVFYCYNCRQLSQYIISQLHLIASFHGHHGDHNQHSKKRFVNFL